MQHKQFKISLKVS